MNVLRTNSILPLSKEFRYAIIDQQVIKAVNAKTEEQESNQDYLVRIYLGRKRVTRSLPPSVFQLRNFNLCVGMIHDLNIADSARFEKVVATMGHALAILYWGV